MFELIVGLCRVAEFCFPAKEERRSLLKVTGIAWASNYVTEKKKLNDILFLLIVD